MNDVVGVKLKEIVNLQDIIKTDEPHDGHTRYIHEGHLPLKDADYKQRNFAAKLKNLDKDKKTIEK